MMFNLGHAKSHHELAVIIIPITAPELVSSGTACPEIPTNWQEDLWSR